MLGYLLAYFLFATSRGRGRENLLGETVSGIYHTLATYKFVSKILISNLSLFSVGKLQFSLSNHPAPCLPSRPLLTSLNNWNVYVFRVENAEFDPAWLQ